jgi:BNR repeat-like domain
MMNCPGRRPAARGDSPEGDALMPPFRFVTWARSARITGLALPAAVGLVLVTGTAAYANVSLTRVSRDIYTDTQAQHNTEVEPDVVTSGSTIVSAFQVGRVFGGGASNIGWATSVNGGATWKHGYLPGITGNGGGPDGQASDASVAYDAKAKVWLIASLGLGSNTVDVLVSRSSNGGLTWGKPVTVAGGSNDKGWIVCDDTPTSPHYGNCYAEYDIPGSGDQVEMRTSTDSGMTWGPAMAPSGASPGIGGQPVVQPNGNVVVPLESFATGNDAIAAFQSTDGGASWGATSLVSNVRHHKVAGSLRESPLPSAAVDGAGTVYVTWADCRFRTSCGSNDIVISTSTNGTTWTTPARVPTDATSSGADHFAPGVAVDASTSGASARVGLTYYYYPKAACSASACQLDVGFISSVNGGATWSAATQLAGPMKLSWLPNTSQGPMFGDYIATAVLAGGNAYPVIPVSKAPSGSTFNQAMYAPTGGVAVTGGSRKAAAGPRFAAPRAKPAPALPTAR